MEQEQATAAAQQVMLQFADATGLTGGKYPRRYLWTDAFAVCNFLELYRQTRQRSWLELALRLVDQVHHTLGRHRGDASRSGWISGLDESEGELHPTRGGLRIGKRLDERRPEERADERLEWDRDGQYYHYLTKWMHALHRVARVTGDAVYLRWAMELAQAAHAGFSHPLAPGAPKRLYWKMSIDLSRPQVPSMGQHDPLDGLVTCCELQAAAQAFTTVTCSASGDRPRTPIPTPDPIQNSKFKIQNCLLPEISDLTAMSRGGSWATDDQLGIGGLLCDASRIAQLAATGELPRPRLFDGVVEAALLGLQAVAESDFLRLPVRYRLAFRELGLAIGLKGVERLSEWVAEDAVKPGLEALAKYLPMGDDIESFWMDNTNQETGNWKEHRDINMVMLATSLVPEEFLKAV